MDKLMETPSHHLHAWLMTNYDAHKILVNIGEPKTPLLVPPMSAFRENIERVLRLSMFPVSVYIAGRRFQYGETLAFLDVLGNLPDKAIQGVPDNVAQRRDAILDGLIPSQLPIEMRYPSEEEQITAYGKYGMETIVDVLMPMQVAAAWTVFETLLGDLWEAAVNAHPRILSDLSGQSQETKGREGKKLNLNLLQIYGYDLRNNMGSLLRRDRRFNFTLLDGIQSAYESAFSRDGDDVNNELKATVLRAVNIMRNVIVHKAGICDKEYHDAAWSLRAAREKELGFQGPFAGEPPLLNIGEKLRLDGIILHNNLVACTQCCTRLINAVDSWIVIHI
jgi:hypothetical protein